MKRFSFLWKCWMPYWAKREAVFPFKKGKTASFLGSLFLVMNVDWIVYPEKRKVGLALTPSGGIKNIPFKNGGSRDNGEPFFWANHWIGTLKKLSERTRKSGAER